MFLNKTCLMVYYDELVFIIGPCKLRLKLKFIVNKCVAKRLPVLSFLINTKILFCCCLMRPKTTPVFPLTCFFLC